MYTKMHSRDWKFIYRDEHTKIYTLSVQIYSQKIPLAPT